MWAKAVMVVGVSLLLMGSTIVITVPQGGRVVSSSGLVACEALETCTIDVSENAFAETFTAVAEPGYEFVDWKDGAGTVCGGSRDADCSELDLDPFAEFPWPVVEADSGTRRTLSPVFLLAEAAAVAQAPRFIVSSFHHTHYYDVGGKTQDDVLQAMQGETNPLDVSPLTGRKPVANASFDARFTFQPEYSANASQCKIASGSLEFVYETTLPRLAITEDTPEKLQQRWQLYQKDIIEHEAEHLANYRQLATQLPEVMAGVAAVPCIELNERVQVAIRESVKKTKRINADYDKHNARTLRIASLSPGRRK